MQQLERAVKPTLPMQEYRAHPAVSKSDLDLIHRSPAHFREAKANPEPPTPAMIWGTMYHLMILEPDLFQACYAVLPDGIDRRTTAGKEAWLAWQAENEGKTPVDRPTLVQLNGMRDALCANSRACEALTGGVAEQSIFWDEDDCTCKCRPDYIKRGLLVDLKTCLDARPDAFSRACWNYRYHVQAAYYSRGYGVEYSEQPEGFLFVAQEKEPPYAVAIYLADEAMVEQGWREAATDLEVYRQCVETDTWPAYPEIVQAIVLPRWAQEEI